MLFLIIYYLYNSKIDHKKNKKMSAFGIVLFLLIGGMGFWLLFFLLLFILPFWIGLGISQKLRPKRVFEEEEN